MDAFATVLSIKALDGLFARQAAVAQNVANANTPGYQPLRVSFERALLEAAARGEGAVGALEPRLERGRTGLEDPQLRLDLELASASETAMRYAALIDVLGRRMQIEALAIQGSR